MLVLDKEVRIGINKMITEELGISSDVEAETRRISQNIIEQSKTVERQIIDDGVSVKQGTYSDTVHFRGKILDISFSWRIFNFKDKTFRQQYCNKYGIDVNVIESEGSSVWKENPSSKYSKDKHNKSFGWLTIYTLSGTFDRSGLHETIRHELMHLYEQTMMNKPYTENSVYDIAKSHINSQNLFERNVAIVLYVGDDSEQRALVNELHEYIKQERKSSVDFDQIVRNSTTIKWVTLMKNALEHIKLNKDEISTTVFNHLSIDKIIKNGEYNLNLFYRRIGRAVVKCKQDFLAEGGRHHSPIWADFFEIRF